jgi:Ni/Fe-hydrogenase 1 B-type cytochrome subunit
MTGQLEQLTRYPVWDKTVRIFHWVNVLCILGLIAVGTTILYSKALGVTSDGKVLLKTVHVYIGYVFVTNLAWRILWGFIGNRFSRWKAVLPLGDEYKRQRQAFVGGLKNGHSTAFLGHNPLARWMVVFLFAILTTMAVTGLVLGGTDVYMQPFGGYFKSWVAESPETMMVVKPYSDEGVNKEAYQAMRDLRKPFGKVHYYGFFFLLAAILLHIAAVVLTELRERIGLVSAMFTGEKVFIKKPIDLEDHSDGFS